tara:strand:- start:4415 stop:4600 length:186 start_codon:yes stop_codon:yes gene_type:complete
MRKKSTSPLSSKRGCLCKDKETYSVDCCEGEVINQGIGALQSDGISQVQNISQERIIVTEN